MNDEELLRYSRHIFLPQLDVEGQLAFKHSRVLVVGAGGLGSAVLPYLVGSGVGEITLVDDDEVELSNLPRQVIHQTEKIGHSKVQSAKDYALALNPDVVVHALKHSVDEAWLDANLAQFSVLVDCTDNAQVRYAINKMALKYQTPWVSGAAIALSGQVTVFDPRQTECPCYRCLYSEINHQQLNCSESGVLSPLVGVIGTLQAVEALKLLANLGKPLTGRLLTYEVLSGSFREWKIKKHSDCADCSKSAD
ncbi:MAG: hypothetical protein RL217_639 [Pseudomonadota bacterium]